MQIDGSSWSDSLDYDLVPQPAKLANLI